jgi:hypothetical protein
VKLGNRGSILRGLVSKNANPTFQRYLDGIGRLVPDNRSIQGGGDGPPLPGLGAGGNNSPVVIPSPPIPQFYYATYGFRVAELIGEGQWSGFVPRNDLVYTLPGNQQYSNRRGEPNNYLYCGEENTVESYDETYTYKYLAEEIIPSLLQSRQTGERINVWLIDSMIFIPFQNYDSPYSLLEENGNPVTKFNGLADISNPSSPIVTLEATRESMGENFINMYPFLFNMNLDENFNTRNKFYIIGGQVGGGDEAYYDWAEDAGGELLVTFRFYENL